MAISQDGLRSDQGDLLIAARAGDHEAFEVLVRGSVRELRAHCYRMLGSLHDAEDALQETLLKAWRSLGAFDGRADVRTWLYRIATNVCLDSLKHASRRVLPDSRLSPADPSEPPGAMVTEPIWLEPFPDRLLPDDSDPEARYSTRESVELGFMVAIHRLAPKQRAVFLLRDVLGWGVGEIATLLETTIPATKSALQRARALIQADTNDKRSRPSPAEERDLLRRYMDAFEKHDVAALVALIREDAIMTMPPDPAWYQGRDAMLRFLSRWVFGMRPSLRVVATAANAQPAMAIYEKRAESDVYEPLALQVLTFRESGIRQITGFVDPSLVSLFDLPRELPA
jgi:RNA polymerase sigma-70 factor (ECF subfamily)